MAEPRDESEDAHAIPGDRDIPPTRKHDAVPPGASSELELGVEPRYPDDGPVSRQVRRVDRLIGTIEQAVLLALLAGVVLVAAGNAMAERFAHVHLDWKDDVVRAGTFSLAMLGAAYASHHQGHLAMDLISRRLPPKPRLALRVGLAAFTVFIVVLLIRAGLYIVEQEADLAANRNDDKLISTVAIARMIPIGGSLIILHTIIHAVIDLDYLVRGKTPPQRIRSAH